MGKRDRVVVLVLPKRSPHRLPIFSNITSPQSSAEHFFCPGRNGIGKLEVPLIFSAAKPDLILVLGVPVGESG
jgi:hypothetical protein